MWQNKLYTADDLSVARQVNFLAKTMGCGPFRVRQERVLIAADAGTYKTAMFGEVTGFRAIATAGSLSAAPYSRSCGRIGNSFGTASPGWR